MTLRIPGPWELFHNSASYQGTAGRRGTGVPFGPGRAGSRAEKSGKIEGLSPCAHRRNAVMPVMKQLVGN